MHNVFYQNNQFFIYSEQQLKPQKFFYVEKG